MKPSIRSRLLVPIIAVAVAAHWAAAQGPLAPGGAPAPTMKTLDQIEPRKPIDATNTPGDATNVFRITASGSYYLAAPLTGVTAKNGISVEASDVTIDLCGFTVAGVAGSLDGIRVTTGNERLTVRNGTVFGWGGDGVDEVDGNATGGVYENVHAIDNTGDGLRLDARCIVKDCKASGNNGHGISVDGAAHISGCLSTGNNLSGFLFGAGSITGCVASANSDSGVDSTDEPVLMKDCVAFDNGDAGFRTSGGGKITGCISRQNSSVGIDTGYYTTVTDCVVKNNGWGIFAGGSCRIAGNMCEGNGDGIYTYGEKNVIDGNQALNGGSGIRCDTGSVKNLIIRNTAAENTTNYSIVADNRYGPIVDISATGTAAVSGNSAADTTTTTHPWANFTYAVGPGS